MTEAKHKKGDIIANHLKMKGKVFDIRWSEAGEAWLYYIDVVGGGQAVIKESNIKYK